MASTRSDNVLICGTCFEQYDEQTRRPKSLSCGHTVCHSCVVKLLEMHSPSCPICRKAITQKSAELIPYNFTVESFLFYNNRNSVIDAGKNASPSDSIVSNHICITYPHPLAFRCMDCKEFMCGGCAATRHVLHDTLTTEDAYKKTIENLSKKVEFESRKSENYFLIQTLKSLVDLKETKIKEIKALESRYEEKISKKIKDLEECDKQIEIFQTLKSEEERFRENLNIRQAAVEGSSGGEFWNAVTKLDDFILRQRMILCPIKTLNAQWSIVPPTIELLRMLCEERSVHAIANEDGDTLFGHVEVVEDKIWISSFNNRTPTGHLFSFNDLLFRFLGSDDLPKKAFLKVAASTKINEVVVDLILETDGASPRAKNFILLCSALKGSSYKGHVLDYDVSLPNRFRGLRFGSEDGSVYKLHGTPSITPVVDGIEDFSSSNITKAGQLLGMDRGNTYFSIRSSEVDCRTPNDAELFHTKFGDVTSGIEKLEKLAKLLKPENNSFTIKECGLII